MNRRMKRRIYYVIVPAVIFLVALIFVMIDAFWLNKNVIEVNLLILMGAIVLDVIYILVMHFIEMRWL